jgi:hypothetical protein
MSFDATRDFITKEELLNIDKDGPTFEQEILIQNAISNGYITKFEYQDACMKVLGRSGK